MEPPGGMIVPLHRDLIGPASEMLTKSFFHDSKLCSVIPDEAERRERARHLFEFEIRYGLNYGMVYTTSPSLEGLAVWLPSEKSEITFWRAFRSGGMRLQGGLGKENMQRLMAFSDAVDRLHKKHAPNKHCYLFFIGIDPGFQGRKMASRLIRPVLGRLDHLGMPCYLNTQNEKNIPIYQHFGFDIVEQLVLPGTEILHTGMLRKPADKPAA
jgi:ribosomal protein S18 acetylase RimI-like enzyme